MKSYFSNSYCHACGVSVVHPRGSAIYDSNSVSSIAVVLCRCRVLPLFLSLILFVCLDLFSYFIFIFFCFLFQFLFLRLSNRSWLGFRINNLCNSGFFFFFLWIVQHSVFFAPIVIKDYTMNKVALLDSGTSHKHFVPQIPIFSDFFGFFRFFFNFYIFSGSPPALPTPCHAVCDTLTSGKLSCALIWAAPQQVRSSKAGDGPSSGEAQAGTEGRVGEVRVGVCGGEGGG